MTIDELLKKYGLEEGFEVDAANIKGFKKDLRKVLEEQVPQESGSVMNDYLFSTEYQFTEPIGEFYGELEDYILIRLNEGKVQLRKVVKSTDETKLAEDSNNA